MIKTNAGMMRGFRIVNDPKGILISPFDSNGIKYGYILTYGEGTPAIHDGTDWVSVLEEEMPDLEQRLPEYISNQAMAIAMAINEDPVYADLASKMNIVMPGSGPVVPGSEPVVYS
jgi:hypothetical protein